MAVPCHHVGKSTAASLPCQQQWTSCRLSVIHGEAAGRLRDLVGDGWLAPGRPMTSSRRRPYSHPAGSSTKTPRARRRPHHPPGASSSPHPSYGLIHSGAPHSSPVNSSTTADPRPSRGLTARRQGPLRAPSTARGRSTVVGETTAASPLRSFVSVPALRWAFLSSPPEGPAVGGRLPPPPPPPPAKHARPRLRSQFPSGLDPLLAHVGGRCGGPPDLGPWQ